MNNKRIIILCIIAFLLGESEGVVQQNRKNQEQIKKLRKNIELLKLKNEMLAWVLGEAPKLSHEEQRKQYNEKARFFRIAKEL